MIFYKTTDVFLAEEQLISNDISVKVVPTPVQDKAYCGISLKLKEDYKNLVNQILDGLEYRIIE